MSKSYGNNRKTSRVSKKRNFCFTFNNYKEFDIEYLKGFFGTEKCIYVFQEEESESGTKHLQGCVSFKNPRSFNAICKKLVGCHVELCRSWKHAVKYCQKKESRVGKVFTNIPKPRDIMDEVIWKSWQFEIIEIIKSKKEMRKIYWFWESDGNVGKSMFCRHLILEYDAVVLGGRYQDAYRAIQKRQELGKKTEIVVFDINRSFGNKVSYSAIEGLKKGFFFSPKYESEQVVLEDFPHVIVFSNFEPDKYECSADRWIVKNIAEIKKS